MAIQTRTVDYTHVDTVLEGVLVYDDRRALPLPSVLIAHAWGGRDHFVLTKAKRLAEWGYAAFAIDMYGKGILGSGPEENARLMRPFMEDRCFLQSRIMAALDTVRIQSEVDARRIAALGFCFGGLCVLDLARTGADLRGVASFHGLLTPMDRSYCSNIKAKVLILHGFDDPMAPPEDLISTAHELTDLGADWQIHTYGHTVHAFTNPHANDPAFGTVYNETADSRSWQSVQNFLSEVLN